VLQHPGPVLDQLGAAVEGAVVDHLEGDVGIAVVDAFCTRGAGDHRKHDDTEAIDEAGTEQRAAEAEAAERTEETGAVALHCPDVRDGVAAHEGGVGPPEGLLERCGEHHLRRSLQLVERSLLLVCSRG
jgi:hypothetical protein